MSNAILRLATCVLLWAALMISWPNATAACCNYGCCDCSCVARVPQDKVDALMKDMSTVLQKHGIAADVLEFRAVEASASQKCVTCICDGMPFGACCPNTTPRCKCQPPGYSCR
jgi:hypothetical protein